MAKRCWTAHWVKGFPVPRAITRLVELLGNGPQGSPGGTQQRCEQRGPSVVQIGLRILGHGHPGFLARGLGQISRGT